MFNLEMRILFPQINRLTRRILLRKLFASFLLILLGFSNIYSQQLRIMPLGNSITHGERGSNPYGGFRDDLAHFLLEENIYFDLVGTLNDGTEYPWHEGHPGKESIYLANHVYSWLGQTYPDIVLLHIGTNDISGDRNVIHVRNDIEQILINIWSYNSDIPVLLCSVIPRKDSTEKNMANTDLCRLIHQLAIDKLEQGKPIRYVGQNEVWVTNPNWAGAYLYDSLHPNNTGYSLMAEVYFNILINQITGTSQFITENFDRSSLGYTWENESSYRIVYDQMTTDTGGDFWWKPAIYIAEMDPIAVSFTWGTDVDPSKGGNAGLALLLNSSNLNRVDGYLIYKESKTAKLRLFLIKDGSVDQLIDEVEGIQDTPYSNDEFKVAFYSDEYGHHFNCFINDHYDGELTDPGKLEGGSSNLYAGILLAGTENNIVDNFKLTHFIGQVEIMFAIAGDGQAGKVNTTLSDALVVGVADINGNPKNNIPVTFEITAGDASIEELSAISGYIKAETENGNSRFTMNKKTVITNSSGKAFVKVKLGSTPGPVEITVTSNELSDVVIFHAAIISGYPAQIAISDGNNQSAPVGELLPLPLEVYVTDQYQNPVQNALVLFEVIQGEGALLDENQVSTGADGKASSRLKLGPNEGIYRVQASCPGYDIDYVIFEATAYPATHTISGNITYFSNNSPINKVMLNVTGDETFVDSSDSDGHYFFDSISPGSNLKISPTKEADDYSDELITVHNAALTMQHVVQLDTLEGKYLDIADVDKNGDVQAFDAALIAHYAIGLPKTSDSYVGEWMFYPPHRQYFNITVNYDKKDYTGLLLGDIEGNWNQSQGLRKELMPVLYPLLNDFIVQSRKTFTLPLMIDENKQMISCHAILKYDSEFLSCINVKKTELTDNFELVYNDKNGFLRAGLYSAYEVNDAGVVVEFIFQAKGNIDQQTTVSLEKYQINNEIVQQATAVVSIQAPKTIPMEFVLYQNYPNPFNPSTIIPYQLPQAGNVRITIYNLVGQKIANLYEGYQQKGSYKFKWNGTDRYDNDVGGGVFICETTFIDQRKTIKIIKLH